MKRIVLLAILFVAAIGFGLLIKADPGYLLLSYRNWTVEMPLWFGIVCAVVLFLLLHWLLNTLHCSAQVPRRIRDWSSKKRMRTAYRQKNRGLIALTEGNWSQAETLLVKSARLCQSKLINYLAAAKAAQEQGKFAKRDAYIQLAHGVQPDAKLAIGLTQAKLAFDLAVAKPQTAQPSQNPLEQALATLRNLHDALPHNIRVLSSLKDVYLALGDVHSLANLFPALRKCRVLPSAEIEALELKTYPHIFRHSPEKKPAEIDAIWHSLSRRLRKHPTLIAAYADYLLDNHRHTEAEKLLRTAIKQQWNDDLVYRYGKLSEGDVKKPYAHAEAWLKTHKDNATLLLTLARLAMLNQLWGKARHYFELSLEHEPQDETYYELGKLLEQLNETTSASNAYRSSIELHAKTHTNNCK